MAKTDRELLEEMSVRIEKMQRQMEAEKRKRLIIAGIVVLILIILAIIIVPKAVNAYRQYCEVMNTVKDITDKIEETVDIEKIKSIADTIGNIDFSKINDITDKLGEIDFSALSSLMEKLQSLGALISKFS